MTEIVFILDKSGSMSGLEKDTIGGFNSFINRQKEENVEAFVSVVLFSDNSEVAYDRVPLAKIEPMNDKQYRVGGCTALLDSVGDAINHIKNIHKYARKEDVPEKTIFVITTDGEENSSERYSQKDIKKLISKHQEEGWEFLFLGANIDAVSEGSKLGIKAQNAVRYECDSIGTETNFRALSNAVCRFANSAVFEPINSNWADEIREDFANRSGNSVGSRGLLGRLIGRK